MFSWFNMLVLKIVFVCCFFVKIKSFSDILKHEGKHYENNWSVRIVGGPEIARKIAQSEGFHIFKENEALQHIYRFHKPDYPNITTNVNHEVADKLMKYDEVSWVNQHIAVERKSRRMILLSSSPRFQRSASCPRANNPNAKSNFANLMNDELFVKEWYLQECRVGADEPQTDLNVVPVWYEKGYNYFGKGVVVVVIDDGVLTTHKDLNSNYNSEFGLDLQENDFTPDPVTDAEKSYSHGTRCAGVIAMLANNEICGVGIAPLATIGGVRLLGSLPSNDYKDGRALSFKHHKVDIYSNSWGPNDDGVSMSKIGFETKAALKLGAENGRRGRGSVYIFAAGNGKASYDMCGADPFVSSIYTIAVASCDQDGKITKYSERCASVMVTTYSGDTTTRYNVVTTDVGAPGNNKKCTTEHNGTSASAPMVSAAIALAVEANKNITRRGIEHALTWTSEVAPLEHKTPGVWNRNGAGFYVSHDFGFGLLNIFNFVKFAKTFRALPPKTTCVVIDPIRNLKSKGNVKLNRAKPFKLEINTNACKGLPSEVNYLEHVQLTVSVKYPKRGDIEVTLISPYGTKAKLLECRPLDNSYNGLDNWSFDSIMTWGESPRGTWTVIIAVPRAASAYYAGEVKDLSLVFHGTKEKPMHYTSARTYQKFSQS